MLDFSINMKTAKALGLKIRPSLWLRADAVHRVNDSSLPNLTLQRAGTRDARLGH